MSIINKSKNLGDWGRFTPVNASGSIHITRTNNNAFVGSGAHVTTQYGGDSYRTFFDSNGNFIGNDF